MTPLTAYAPGICARCKGTIEVGEAFAWGAERGTRTHAVACTGAAEPAVDGNVVEFDFSGLTPANTAVPEPVTDTRVWSSYQEVIFEFGVNGTGSGIIYGVAGCAKTSSLEEMAKRIADAMPAIRIKYLVFNRRNAVEAQERMPSNVDASTFHASCNAMLSQHLHRPQLNGNKVRDIAQSIVNPMDWRTHGPNLVKLVGLGKNSGLGLPGIGAIDSHDAWQSIIDEYGIEFDLGDTEDEERREAIMHGIRRYAAQILTASNADTTQIDFDDMLYLTCLLDVPLPRFPVVCVDEAQDTNVIQRLILHKMVAPGGRLIAVGDPKQAIYHFRGASADAMDLIRNEFKCRELPLSINYRCSQAVVRAAQAYCPQLEAWDGSPEGSVEPADELLLADYLPTDAILCRTNAPLVQQAMRFLRAGIACKILGRDIGQSLITLIDKTTRKQRTTLDMLETAIATYGHREAQRFTRKGDDAGAAAIQDKIAAIDAIIDGMPADTDSYGVIDQIRNMFSDTEQRGLITLATIHKAKGLEWSRVFLLNRSQMPPRWVKLPAQLDQEENIMYVAYTRAKVDLRFIEIEGRK